MRAHLQVLLLWAAAAAALCTLCAAAKDHRYKAGDPIPIWANKGELRRRWGRKAASGAGGGGRADAGTAAVLRKTDRVVQVRA